MYFTDDLSSDDNSDCDNLDSQEIEQALSNCDVIKIQVTEEDKVTDEEIIKLRNNPKPKEFALYIYTPQNLIFHLKTCLLVV